METTDLHGNMMPYDYFANQYDSSYGLARTAVVIGEARSEVENSMLFDNGDLIQGSPMADYLANLGVAHLESNTHPVYKAMNLLDYDAANIGNHEFNYGLDFLHAAIEGANFPYVVSNVFEYNENLLTASHFASNSCETRIDDEFLASATTAFNPYIILERTFVARDGQDYTINVGVIGFTPPNIMSWDKSYLECEVVVSDIKATAEYYVPLMKEAGADIIVAVPHSGLTGSDADLPFQENATWQIAQVDGIDAIMFGHDHNNFPSTTGFYDGMEGVNAPEGKIYGKPAVMPGFWGNHLGVIDLVVQSNDQGETWTVNYEESTAELRALPKDKLEISPVIAASVATEHVDTQEYMATPILGITQKINSFFSAIVPDLSVQIVNEAQFHWANQLEELSFDNGEILLSVSAPFKGGRGGADDYTNINGDELTNASVADLYVFDNNTPAVLKLTVADIKEWLESIASQQYQTVTNEGDYLLNQMFRSYNFDVFYGGWDADGQAIGLHYDIDVSQAPRYQVDENGELVTDEEGYAILNENGIHRRILNFSYDGVVLDDNQVMYVVTNNYRASNTKMPGVMNSELALEDAAYTNRELVDQYLKHLAETAGSETVTVPEHTFENAENFSLVGPSQTSVKFLSSPNGEEFSREVEGVTFTTDTGNVGDNGGYSVYTYTFN
ncbi:bifunctional 2',3'-cyclic-nucleotide 2'-phosphodiesterase/3'-nucleotidase [Vibrio ishigakensis]